jgi:hypothetical protein
MFKINTKINSKYPKIPKILPIFVPFEKITTQ